MRFFPSAFEKKKSVEKASFFVCRFSLSLPVARGCVSHPIPLSPPPQPADK